MTKPFQSRAARAAYDQGAFDFRKLLSRSGFVGESGALSARKARADDDLVNDDSDDDTTDDDEVVGEDGKDSDELICSFSAGHFSKQSKSGGLNVYRRSK